MFTQFFLKMFILYRKNICDNYKKAHKNFRNVCIFHKNLHENFENVHCALKNIHIFGKMFNPYTKNVQRVFIKVNKCI